MMRPQRAWMEPVAPSATDNVRYDERFGLRVEREVTLLPDEPPHRAMRRSAP